MKSTAFLIVASLLLGACSASGGEDPNNPRHAAAASESAAASETTPVHEEMPMSETAEPRPDQSERGDKTEQPAMAKVVKTDAEWRALLSDEEYRVARQAGTERAFTGRYWDKKDAGSYACVGCGLVLFESDTKYESGCGWPSFWKTLAADRVRYIEDSSLGMVRTEVQCARCDAHLGHLFDDGPEPTGQRYCMNSVSLKFTPRAAAK